MSECEHVWEFADAYGEIEAIYCTKCNVLMSNDAAKSMLNEHAALQAEVKMFHQGRADKWVEYEALQAEIAALAEQEMTKENVVIRDLLKENVALKRECKQVREQLAIAQEFNDALNDELADCISGANDE